MINVNLSVAGQGVESEMCVELEIRSRWCFTKAFILLFERVFKMKNCVDLEFKSTYIKNYLGKNISFFCLSEVIIF